MPHEPEPVAPAEAADARSGPGAPDTLLASDLSADVVRLIRARWVAGALVPAATALCVYALRLPLPEIPLYILGAAILAYNAGLAWYMARIQRPDIALRSARMRQLVLAQVALDWLALAVFLHLTGGIFSPAVPVLLIHILLVAVLLPGRMSYGYTVLGVGVLAVVAMLEQAGILPHHAVIAELPDVPQASPVFMWAVILFFLATAVVTVYLASGIMQRLGDRERQIMALFNTSRAVSSTLSLSEVMDRLARSAAEALSVPSASIRLLDESGERLSMTAAYGLSDEYISKGPVDVSRSRLDEEALLGHPVIVRDASTDVRIQYPRQVSAEGIRSILVVPIVLASRPLGVLRVYSPVPGRFTERDVLFVTSIAAQGAFALQNALAHDALQRADRERAQFVRTVTHELRAPVTGAQSLLRVLVRGLAGEVTADQRDILDRLERRFDALLELIDDLLALAASKISVLREQMVRLPLQPVVRQVLDRLRQQAEDKHISLAFDAPREVLPVLATEDGLSRIVINLVGNAIKYTPAGGSVSVKIVERMPYAVLTVEDTGIGIPEADLADLWKEFHRASNARRSGITGTGLGLSIVHQLVQQFGGQVSVRSVEGQGTVFKVSLPLDRGGESLS
jgi:signal transduction histidine kinase